MTTVKIESLSEFLIFKNKVKNQCNGQQSISQFVERRSRNCAECGRPRTSGGNNGEFLDGDGTFDAVCSGSGTCRGAKKERKRKREVDQSLDYEEKDYESRFRKMVKKYLDSRHNSEDYETMVESNQQGKCSNEESENVSDW